VFYKDLSVLQELIYKATSLFNDKVVGYNIYTQDEKVYKDFEHFGFYLDTKMQMSTDRGLTYYVMGENIDVESSNQYHVITSKEVVNEYDVIQKKEDDKYKKEFNIKEVVEAVHYVALDGDSFAGGVYMQLYTDSMYIDLLAVKTEYKGQKIGTKLMEFAEELARGKGFESIDLGTTEFQARPFYEKLGYNVIRTQQNLPKGFECYTLIKQLR
jgi:ribosomal protein S18 acetylase RimI-like enzyme